MKEKTASSSRAVIVQIMPGRTSRPPSSISPRHSPPKTTDFRQPNGHRDSVSESPEGAAKVANHFNYLSPTLAEATPDCLLNNTSSDTAPKPARTVPSHDIPINSIRNERKRKRSVSVTSVSVDGSPCRAVPSPGIPINSMLILPI